MAMLFFAWQFGGHNPYVLYNAPGAPPSPYPDRVRQVLYGFGLYAAEREAELAGAKQQRRALGG